ncbi:hypothetical protein FK220_002045 [Flavobacteriaceae bacterium TP-CH-4]|uniref:Por secretion system C-terminal sorting domain-containing protein n=1 Tax=Pelagihabitans pacificus TaxID=2696054 RepID=A0A967ARY9_9FLAO|nr:hypothetical protein [Pelagihabitans pacificus]NHF58105.1 hypothetical protein [Pelagihabitans pacificus]
MKKTAKTTATIALMFSMFIGLANEPKISTDTTNRSLDFEMAAPSAQTMVRLIDDKEQVIYSANVDTQSDFAKRFDLSKLPNGNYYLVVEDAIKELTFTLSLDASKVEVIDRDEDTKPVFRKKDGKLYVNLLNLDLNKVDIIVYDGDGRKLFSERSTGKQIVQKAFNFENAYSDSYMVVVRDNEKTYYEDIVVK